MRLIGYTRSSDAWEQAESHASQETTIRAWARAHGHRSVRVISEPAGTRGTTAKRDGWADVLNALEDGQGDGIVVREADLRDDPEDPTRRLIRIIIGAVHAHNRDMTVLRMQRGKRRERQRGGYLGGTTRYGYQPVEKELIPDPTEQAVTAPQPPVAPGRPVDPQDRRPAQRRADPGQAWWCLAPDHRRPGSPAAGLAAGAASGDQARRRSRDGPKREASS